MKKKKRFYPRHVRALRRLAVALGLLLFCNCVLHVGLLLPIQALRVCEQSEGVYERTRVVWRRWEPNMMHLVDALYLTESENTLSLFCTHPGLSGWLDGFVWPVDASDGGGAHLGLVDMSRDKHERTVVFYGRIDASDVTRLELHGESVDRNTGFALGVSQDNWFVRDGKTYLLLAEPCRFGKWEQAEYSLIVETEDGETAEYPVEQVASVSWG